MGRFSGETEARSSEIITDKDHELCGNSAIGRGGVLFFLQAMRVKNCLTESLYP